MLQLCEIKLLKAIYLRIKRKHSNGTKVSLKCSYENPTRILPIPNKILVAFFLFDEIIKKP